jgi:helix-turn-helix protein
MATRDEQAGLPIGEVLKRTRARREIDIRTVEQETKIRIKYLRALENEEWDVLPGPAYARGFLRTYAQFLGLDGDALIDEYRRTVEAGQAADHPYAFGEPLLERRLRPGAEPRRPWRGRVIAVVALLAVAAGVLVVLGLGSDEDGKRSRHPKDAHQGQEQAKSGPAAGKGSSKPVKIALVTQADMEVCLVTGQGEALIDAQTLVSGTSAGPYGPADNYRLDLQNGGPIRVEIDGRPHPLDPSSAATYDIDSNGIEKAPEYRGPGCP